MSKKQMAEKKVKRPVISINRNYNKKYGFKVASNFIFKAEKGLSEEIVKQISQIKDEPKWMLDYRLNSLKIFNEKKMPDWGPELSKIDFSEIYYYLKPTQKTERKWKDVPAEMKNTFERLRIPQAERSHL